MLAIESAGVTDVGEKRKNNEDALLLDDDLRLYIVADGMGGHLAGEVASKLVVETIRDYLTSSKEGSAAEAQEDTDKGFSREANRLLFGINLANRGVYHMGRNDEACHGMGSTVSAVYFTDDAFIAANVGDSPVYLVRKNNVELLSVTHNVLAEQTAKNPDAARLLGAEYKHMLTRAMGIEERVRPDICEMQYVDGDVITISSDGLSDKVSSDEIFNVVKNETPEIACQTLVDLANMRGGDDNISVIVLKVRTDKRGKKGIAGRVSNIFFSVKKILT
jgi:PPM family protein phosphatase